MYVIGNSAWNFIAVKMTTLYDGKRIYQEVGEIIHNIRNEACTIYNNYEEAEHVLDNIKTNEKTKITNDSIIDSILDGHQLNIDTLKIYELVPTEICK
ncbi:hypothetical protein KQI61_15420 [Anaerocolumna aminovalerica]|uniref:hypothetical protein n=1 Tax=Anaerocolumna aminovalerica TaxID=1527 RepID=UPI001C0EF44A|nr:hypothetical protein [Anaerocolumna aminovalerica]MBU5333588.1 hypothetical protein [Anaerocolumna aminovalerica]